MAARLGEQQALDLIFQDGGALHVQAHSCTLSAGSVEGALLQKGHRKFLTKQAAAINVNNTQTKNERRRSRSTSRERERRRRERDRSRSRDRDRDRRRSRSRSPHRRRSRSPPRRHRSSSLSPVRQKDRREDDRKEVKESKAKPIQISAEDMQGKTEEEIEMMKLMGFSSFDTSKGKKSEASANAHAINVSMKRKYRGVQKNKQTVKRAAEEASDKQRRRRKRG
ncbi:hypothetical protein L3Q82_006724 [Scortum barcoo]|uniref:Uncharacterized protein n=1 Tax=Scortum barcoo TaxID=214431 RepID=A0ACB8WX18_9TELE|nr:hypothetical protein L3Q82_006724 [Scortum barcoo]